MIVSLCMFICPIVSLASNLIQMNYFERLGSLYFQRYCLNLNLIPKASIWPGPDTLQQTQTEIIFIALVQLSFVIIKMQSINHD